MLSSMVKDNIDILMVSETKLDSSFPQAQFRIEGYAPPFRYDRLSWWWHSPFYKRRYSYKDNQHNTFQRFLRDFCGIINVCKKKVLLCCPYTLIKILSQII